MPKQILRNPLSIGTRKEIGTHPKWSRNKRKLICNLGAGKEIGEVIKEKKEIDMEIEVFNKSIYPIINCESWRKSEM